MSVQEKKNDFSDCFAVGNNEKKKRNIYNEKTKKKNGADLEWATAQLYFKRKGIVLQYMILYCSEEPRMGWKCIAIHWFVLQEGQLYCNRGGWPGRKLYCNTV